MRKIKIKIQILKIDIYMFLGFLTSFIFFDADGVEFFLNMKIEYIVISCLVIAWAVMIKNIKITSLTVAYLIYIGVIAFSTFLNNRNELLSLAFYALRLITSIMFIDYVIRTKHFDSYFRGVKWFLFLAIFLTIFFQIYKQDYFGYTPSGNYNNFLVSDNYLGFYYVSFFMIIYFTSFGKSQSVRKIEMIICMLICIYSVTRAWSAMAMVGLIIYLFGFLGINISKFLQRKMTFLNAVLLNVTFFYLVVFMRIHKYFEWLITGILHKGMTLSRRTEIWDATIKNIMKKPFIGYGTCKGQVMMINTWVKNGQIYTFFSHNYFLENMIQGGILAVIALGIIYYVVYRRCRDKKVMVSKHYNVATLTVFCLLLLSQLGMVLYSPVNHLPIIFAYYCKEIMLSNGSRKVNKESFNNTITLDMGRE